MSSEELVSVCSTQRSIDGSNPPPPKKKRNLPGTPDPEAEVIALSPKTLMATNRFVCEICGKGFQRDQNLQLHRRGHNLPWKLKQRSSKEAARKRVYVCPEKTCVHHHPSRALGDLTGIKKHFCRKHGDKKWKCDKCSKRYAVHSDWKAHTKTCGTREYKCDCGTLFSRRDSFITHRAFCDALAEETARVTAAAAIHMNTSNLQHHHPATTTTTFNYHLIGQHFHPIFKPIQNPSNIIDPIRASQLSLWMTAHDHSPKNLQQINNSLGISITSGLNSFTSHGGHDHPNPPPPPPPPAASSMNWDFGNKLSSSSDGPDHPTIPIPIQIPNLPKEVSTSPAPSLFSTQIHSHQQLPISATALLQKAAQIGATADPSFLGSFALKGSESTTVSVQDKFCGLYATNSSATSGLGSDMESSVNDLPPLNHMDMDMNPSGSKRRRTMNNDEMTGGKTRDFLGVGIQSICHHPSSINGWM
ncbi:zinc finger protein NUTCRACKER-like [Andrographis paniculata]|uniref:zinc finger protein NUTCRACKER-like n=1 Tax=Andrographis paniculata TaxID=175694 RepID=UPI0021E8DDDF|nr:zinc finger protein NUTCRACKER-like [Andrographis paniculata]